MKHWITILSIVFSLRSFAYETDQYTLPPYPLKDISADISSYVYQQLEKTLEQYEKLSGEEKNHKKLAQLAFENIGGGVALTERVEGWLGNGPFAPDYLKQRYPNDHISFRQDVEQSIYAGGTYHRGFGLAYKYLFSATINLYGIELGSDKLGHFFKQGHQYFDLYLGYKDQGHDHHEAQKMAAYNRGVKTENSYFGLGLSGVFSNADLFTNYTGMKFYQNLLNPLKVGNKTYLPMIDIKSMTITVAPQELMRRFIYQAMNEASNPSTYDRIIAKAVRKNMLKRCQNWKNLRPYWTREFESHHLNNLKTWFGEDYGHSLISFPKRDLITVANVCQL